MPRHFRVCDGRTVTLPQDLQAGPGATNMRLNPGTVVTLEDEACQRQQRFVNGRKNAGDWEELDAPPAEKGPEPELVKSPFAAPEGDLGLGMHGSTPKKLKKEG